MSSWLDSAYSPPSHFERRREAYLDGRARKRFVTEFVKDEIQRATESKELAAALRSARRLAGALDRILPGEEQIAALLAQAFAGPHANFGPRMRCRSLRAYEYCAYVRALITVEGMAKALGVSRKRAGNAISALAAEGLLRKTRRLCTRTASFPVMWEWAGP